MSKQEVEKIEREREFQHIVNVFTKHCFDGQDLFLRLKIVKRRLCVRFLAEQTFAQDTDAKDCLIHLTAVL